MIAEAAAPKSWRNRKNLTDSILAKALPKQCFLCQAAFARISG
jgi:hypothetical protein